MNRREFVKTAAIGAMASALPIDAQVRNVRPPSYQVGAYYFPNWHVDPLNEQTHGKGWTEWEILKRAEAKYPGHQQPKVPLWGYEDEADPTVFAKKIDAAASSGLTYFIYDWYWFNNKPFLNGALEKGHLAAPNRDKLHFCLMWANQDWVNMFPAKLHMPYQPQYSSLVDQAQFEMITSYIIEHYFSVPIYWKVDGAPYFSIYDLASFLKGFGGIDGAKTAIDRFRKKTVANGLPGLHVNAVDYGIHNAIGSGSSSAARDLIARLGVDSVTSYTWIHNATLNTFPSTSYSEVFVQAENYWNRAESEFGVPYYPNVSMGWDSSPRACQSDVYTRTKYPFLPIVKGNSPATLREAILRVRAHIDSRRHKTGIFNINAWNEWTEGSYLEPDNVHGMEYLHAVRDALRA